MEQWRCLANGQAATSSKAIHRQKFHAHIAPTSEHKTAAPWRWQRVSVGSHLNSNISNWIRNEIPDVPAAQSFHLAIKSVRWRLVSTSCFKPTNSGHVHNLHHLSTNLQQPLADRYPDQPRPRHQIASSHHHPATSFTTIMAFVASPVIKD